MSADHTVTVRPGTPRDVEEALAIMGAAEARRKESPLHVEESHGRGQLRLTSPDTFFFVAQSAAGSLLGLAAGMSGREDGGAGLVIPGLCHISMVAVHPDQWGRGLGKRLIQALLAAGRSYGYDRFQLFTHADNARAQRLYEGTGFELTGQTAVSDTGENIVHYLWVPPRLP